MHARPLLVLLPLLACAPAAAQDDSAALLAALDQAVAAAAPRAVEIRHRLHQNPELGYQETETAKLVAEHLRGLGLEVATGIAHTGVVAVLRGGRPGPVVAVRADMDALPVVEQTDLPFRSTKRGTWAGQEVGIAHACGHDVHTAVGLGVASALAAVREDLPGTVKFLFQPAEEGPPPGEVTGALAMLRAGALADPQPDAIFALHSFPELSDGAPGQPSVGKVGWTSGPTYAAVDHFLVTVRGKQSHGAYPHLGIDPIVMAAQAVTAFQTIRSRTLPALEPSVVTVGIIRGGERFNIIPGAVHLEGTVRTYKEEVRRDVERRMREILDGVARAFGGAYELDYRQNAPATVNDPELAAWARPVLARAVGEENVVASPPTMGGEDFAYFANEVPGFYFRLGTLAPGTTSGGLHTPDFRADDSAVPVGIRAMARLVAEYLTRGR
ncbi:MAG TPA: amidohydrolase [Thermoanaerobaculia bacterium]|nr:amidohydrolase [Thermoanaerobaculia bacterium]